MLSQAKHVGSRASACLPMPYADCHDVDVACHVLSQAAHMKLVSNLLAQSRR